MTIITQENEIVNYLNLKHISVYTGEIENVECYAIIAFSIDSTIVDDITDGAIHLGVYNSEAECLDVMNNLINALETERRIFRMPAPVLVS